MQTLALVGRVVLSLVVVLVLLWFAVRGMRKQQRTSAGVSLDVLARQPLAQRSSVAVVRLGERALVLGVSEGRVELLADKPLSEVMTEPQEEQVTTETAVAPQLRRAVTTGSRRRATAPALTGALAGSALSPQTWSRALDVLREKTVRR